MLNCTFNNPWVGTIEGALLVPFNIYVSSANVYIVFISWDLFRVKL